MKLCVRNEEIIKNGQWLEDEHMDHFFYILKSCSNYNPRNTLLVQIPDNNESVQKNVKHIQILHSCDDFKSNQGGHWVCSFYDGKSIYIYDSLNRKSLHAHHEIFLKKLFPFYNINNESVIFPVVQSQRNGNDCGVFAIAFATSLLYNIKPNEVLYDQKLMRQHLIQILKSNRLDHFPVISKQNEKVKIVTFDVLQNRHKAASRKRELRKRESEEQRLDRLKKASTYINENRKKESDKQRSERLKKASTYIKEKRKSDKENKDINVSKNVCDNKSNLKIHLSIKTDHSILVINNDEVLFREKETSDIYKNEQEANIKYLQNNKNKKVAKLDNMHENTNGIEIDVQKESNYFTLNSENTQISVFKKISNLNSTSKKHALTNICENEILSDPKQFKHNNYSLNYNDERSNVLMSKRVYYELNKKDILGKRKRFYELNKEAKLKKQKISYEINKESRIKKMKLSYDINREAVLEKRQNSYKLNKETILKRKKIYYQTNKSVKLCVTKKIIKKYNHINRQNNNIALKFTAERYIQNLTKTLGIPSLTESRMEAERIIKWCLYTRNSYITSMKKNLKEIKRKAEVSVTRSKQCTSIDIMNKVNSLCGLSKHIASSEQYFYETSYYAMSEILEANLDFSVGTGEDFPTTRRDLKRNITKIVMNSEGKCINIMPILESKNKTKKIWHCNFLCKIKDANLINDLKEFYENLLQCTLRKLHKFITDINRCSNKVNYNKFGHSHGCYINYKLCRSKFLATQILSSHFPEVRYIKRLLYDLIALDANLNNLDKALNENDVNVLQEISKEAQENAAAHKEKFTEMNLNEDDIKSQYFLAFKAFTKRSIDIPKWPCISCEKLCFERNVTRIKICNKTYGSKLWSRLLQHLDYKENDTAYICQYCKSKIRFNIMPPTCILNNLDARNVPEEIDNLNDYERILIQRAKAFQTVLRMGTVMNKNIQHRFMIPKVKGRTFHLPLPLEETFKKICPSHVPINVNHELYILVRGVPTKSNIVWENLVDVNKVWSALLWLKDNNPLYSEIVLPTSSDGLLLHSNLQDTEFQIDNDLREDDEIFEEINDENKENKALLTQKSQSDSYYDQYTIYPMYEGRSNESATELYQMLKVHDCPLNFDYKDLDLKCFPDLYSYGINGQHENRNVRLTNFEFIKSRLMSKHSRFRLNIQYLFYLLHDSNIRNINAGIYHKLNITNPREKYTAGSYLEKLSKHQLETNLNTIFARLRNTPQYWIRPRCMLKCMIRNYGPATWFLILSPSEWL
ncbi:putative autophagy-related protein 11 [Prorops nasuta]|uniref:putative autophagy-related protein 11 n=1 Tax=Prorops nasuta TaxID=863751 RepID=UPI0034CDD8A2